MGITIGFFKAYCLPVLLPVVCLLLVLLTVFWYTNKNSFYNTPWFGVILCLFFIAVGCYRYQNTQIHLGRFIDSISSRRIIADGSNYKSYVDSWRKTCNEKKFLFIAPMKRELLYGNKHYFDLKVPLKFF
jgi:hypothetical protein